MRPAPTWGGALGAAPLGLFTQALAGASVYWLGQRPLLPGCAIQSRKEEHGGGSQWDFPNCPLAREEL